MFTLFPISYLILTPITGEGGGGGGGGGAGGGGGGSKHYTILDVLPDVSA